jgi:putative SOS response-associated peptidase YedK
MCGRFSQAEIAALDREVLRLLELPPFAPRFNVAPSQDAAVIRTRPDGTRAVDSLRWGLIPSWATDPKIGYRTINARAESLAAKPAFRDAFERRRCLVPVDGFYEWQVGQRGRQPYFIRRRDRTPLLLAGLWDRWLDHERGPIETFTIVTTPPNTLMEPLHDRMPAILPPEHFDRWLDPRVSAPGELQPLLQPFPSEPLEAYPVSTYVNDPAHEGAECVAPVTA